MHQKGEILLTCIFHLHAVLNVAWHIIIFCMYLPMLQYFISKWHPTQISHLLAHIQKLLIKVLLVSFPGQICNSNNINMSPSGAKKRDRMSVLICRYQILNIQSIMPATLPLVSTGRLLKHLCVRSTQWVKEGDRQRHGVLRLMSVWSEGSDRDKMLTQRRMQLGTWHTSPSFPF